MICSKCNQEIKEELPNRFSFKGWEFREWLKSNKGNLRMILSVILGLTAASIVGFQDLTTAGTVGTLATAISKLILDSFDYYVSK